MKTEQKKRQEAEQVEREIIVLSFTKTGTEQNAKICEILQREGIPCAGCAVGKYACGNIRPLSAPVTEFVGEEWGSRDLLFIGAAGIAVRAIVPWVKDKFTDPAVLVMDEKCRYIIPILSGHVGGAAAWADRIAAMTGAEAVHTTATDVQGKFAVDVFAERNRLLITDRTAAKEISAAVLNGEKIAFYCAAPEYGVRGTFPEELVWCDSLQETEKYRCRIILKDGTDAAAGTENNGFAEKCSNTTDRNDNVSSEINLILKPQNIIAGIGCRKGISEEKLETGLKSVLAEHGFDIRQIECFASIDLKKEEPGILALARKYRVPFITYSADELRKAGEVSAGSSFVESVTGVDNVCERAALRCLKGKGCLQDEQKTCFKESILAGNRRRGETCCEEGKLIQEKCIRDSMTAALVRRSLRLKFSEL